MLFNSYEFICVFLPISLVGYYGIGKIGRKAGAFWLGFSSLVFYCAWNPGNVLILVASIIFNYNISKRIEINKFCNGRQRAWLICGIVINLCALFYYKYFGVLISSVTGSGFSPVPMNDIILPLGISFFTFTQIGYLIDVQQDTVKDRDPLNYFLFVTFFPHLIAGPILHNHEIMPQFGKEETYRFSPHNLTVGSMMFIIGLSKKCLIADPISGRTSEAFLSPVHLTVTGAWLLMLTYAIQIYFDFSGYTDMAIGIARMFNVRFPTNFNSPYKATSIIDFWQRWHMTLTRLLTLYLFNPMALAIARMRVVRGLPVDRKAKARPVGFLTMVVLPLMITMGLAGIWHGAGIKFLIFGILHGVYLTINHAWRIIRPGLKAGVGKLEEIVGWGLTIIAILVALVFFRAPSLHVALTILGAMAGAHSLGVIAFPPGFMDALSMMFARNGAAASTAGVKTIEMVIQTSEVAALWFVVLVMPNSQQIMSCYEPVLGRVTASGLFKLSWRPTAAWALASGVAGAIAMIAVAGTTDFVYFEF